MNIKSNRNNSNYIIYRHLIITYTNNIIIDSSSMSHTMSVRRRATAFSIYLKRQSIDLSYYDVSLFRGQPDAM